MGGGGGFRGEKKVLEGREEAGGEIRGQRNRKPGMPGMTGRLEGRV